MARHGRGAEGHEVAEIPIAWGTICGVSGALLTRPVPRNHDRGGVTTIIGQP